MEHQDPQVNQVAPQVSVPVLVSCTDVGVLCCAPQAAIGHDATDTGLRIYLRLCHEQV